MSSQPLFTAGLNGDWPSAEAARGGARAWGTETSGPVQAMFEGTSLAHSDRQDDFAALKVQALRGLKEKRRRSALVLPLEVRTTPAPGACPWGETPP